MRRKILKIFPCDVWSSPRNCAWPTVILPYNLQSSAKVFADDTLLYGVIANDTDCDHLQDGLKKLEQWQNRWQMKCNPSKCKVLCISNKRSPYTFCGVELKQVEDITYLGITLTSKLKWDQHVSTVASKASKVLSIMRRNLHHCPRLVIKRNGVQDPSPTNPRIWKCRMGSLLREGYSKAGEISEKGSAILGGQLQPLCKRDRNAAGT